MFGIDYGQGYLLGAPAPIDSGGPHVVAPFLRSTIDAAATAA